MAKVLENLAALSLVKLAVETRARCGFRRDSASNRPDPEGTDLTIASRGVWTPTMPGASTSRLRLGISAAPSVADFGSTKSRCASCEAVSSGATGRKTTSAIAAAAANDAPATRQARTITCRRRRSDARGSNTNGAANLSCAARSSENAAASSDASSRTVAFPDSPPVASTVDARPRTRIASTASVNCSGRLPGIISFPLHAARPRTASHEAARRPCAGCS